VSTHVDGERATRAAARGCRKQIADAEQPLLPDQLVELDEFFRRCVDTLPTHRRHVLRHYAVVDVAHEIVGVGSVGTRCLIILIENGDREPLFLQFKEAGADDGRRRWAQTMGADDGRHLSRLVQLRPRHRPPIEPLLLPPTVGRQGSLDTARRLLSHMPAAATPR